MKPPTEPSTRAPKGGAALLLTTLLTVLLSACTGTSEPSNPILLVAGLQDRVALIEDSFGATGASPTRFDFLEASVRELPAPAVAFDVVDRSTTRSELAVLSRGIPQAGAAPTQLTFFALSGLNRDALTGFAQTRQIVLSELEVVPQNLLEPTFCPTHVQVTQNGLYAAVLNNPQVCGGNVQNTSVDILDLAGNRLLERVSGGVLPGALYLHQTPAQDLLYYAQTLPGRLSVQEATLPRPGQSFAPGDTVDKRDVVQLDAPLRQGELQDLSLVGSGAAARLVALFEGGFVNVQGYTGTSPQVGTFVATARSNRLLIRDDTLQTAATLILAAPQERRFSFFPPPQQGPAQPGVDGFVQAVAAGTEPTFGFVYFASEGQLSLFDLRGYTAGRALNVTPFALPELTEPSFVTWAQARPVLTIPNAHR